MWVLSGLWKKITKIIQRKVADKTSGQFETAFFQSVNMVLYLVGLSTSDRSILYVMYSLTIKLLIAGIVGSELYSIASFLSMSSGIDQVIENVNATAIHLIAMYRYKSLLTHKDEYKKLSSAMESPYFDISTPKRKQILNYWLHKNEKYFKLLLALGSCTLMAWYIYPLVDDLEYNLIVPLQLPYNYATPRWYPITYAIVAVAFNYVSYFVMVNDLIMQSHLMHLLCQFVVLQDCFENILEDCCADFQEPNKETLNLNEAFIQKYNKKLGDLVEQHKLILRNTAELRGILSMPMLYQMGASSILICFIAYQATTTASSSEPTKLLMSLLYLGYNLFELLIFCRWCDEIKVQSEKIRQAVYFSCWEDMLSVPAVRSRLMLVVARASRPLVLTAGGVYDLSLSTYATIVKTSYSVLSVLLRARH